MENLDQAKQNLAVQKDRITKLLTQQTQATPFNQEIGNISQSVLAALSANTGAAGQQQAYGNLMQQQNDRIGNQLKAQGSLYDMMQSEVERGNKDAAAVDRSIKDITGDDAMAYEKIANEVHKLPHAVDSGNANLEVMKAANRLGLKPVMSKDSADIKLKQAQANYYNRRDERGSSENKAPAGYRFTSTGSLEAIPGGPAGKLSAESAGKVALIKQGENDINRFAKLITNKDGTFNRAKITALSTYGSPGVRTESSTLFNAVNARLRLESGAAVPESEVKRAMATFAPSALDSDNTIQSKIQRMNEFFGLAKDEIGQGRGSKPVNPNISESDPLGLFNE